MHCRGVDPRGDGDRSSKNWSGGHTNVDFPNICAYDVYVVSNVCITLKFSRHPRPTVSVILK